MSSISEFQLNKKRHFVCFYWRKSIKRWTINALVRMNGRVNGYIPISPSVERMDRMSKKCELLQVTYTLFAKNGDGLSLSAIAQTAGIKKASIYAHFSSKDDLLFQMIDQQIQHYSETTKSQLESLRSASLEMVLCEFYRLHIRYFSEPTRLLFWKRCLLLSDGALKRKVEETHQYVHDRNMNTLITRFNDSAATYNFSEQAVHVFANAYLVLILGTLHSLFVFEQDHSNYEASFSVFWNGLLTHTR